MRLYELNFEMNEIAERLEAALEWEPDTDTLGRPIDFDGNVIDDVEKFREDMIEAWKTTLDGVAEEFDEKAANIAVYIKDLKSESEQLYKARQKRKFRCGQTPKALKSPMKTGLSSGRRRTETSCSAIQSPKSTNLPSKRLSRAEKIFPARKSSARSRL